MTAVAPGTTIPAARPVAPTGNDAAPEAGAPTADHADGVANGSTRRRSLPITRRGWSVVVGSTIVLTVGWLLGYDELTALGAAGIVTVALAGFWLLRTPRVDIERELYPDRVAAGDIAFGRVKVRNRSSRAAAAFVAREQFGSVVLDVDVPPLPPSERVSTAYRLPTTRRGVVAVGPMRIGRVDPLGLVTSEQSHGEVLRLWVHPRHAAIGPQASQRTRSLEGPSSDSSPQGSITFHAVREYVMGDDLRKVHWRSTARTGRLMVRQYVDTVLPDVTIVVDTSAGRPGPQADNQAHDLADDLLERRIEVAASVALASTTRHFPVRVVGTGGLDLSSRGGGQTTRELLDALTLVEADDGNLATVLGAMGRSHGGAGLVVVASAPGPVLVEALASMPRRFGRVTLVDLRPASDPTGGGGGAVERPPAIRGVSVIVASDLAGFASAWRRTEAR